MPSISPDTAASSTTSLSVSSVSRNHANMPAAPSWIDPRTLGYQHTWWHHGLSWWKDPCGHMHVCATRFFYKMDGYIPRSVKPNIVWCMKWTLHVHPSSSSNCQDHMACILSMIYSYSGCASMFRASVHLGPAFFKQSSREVLLMYPERFLP